MQQCALEAASCAYVSNSLMGSDVLKHDAISTEPYTGRAFLALEMAPVVFRHHGARLAMKAFGTSFNWTPNQEIAFSAALTGHYRKISANFRAISVSFPQNFRTLIKFLGNENSARSFSDRSLWKSLRVVDVRALGSWISAPKCLFFFQDFKRPDRSFGPGYPRE